MSDASSVRYPALTLAIVLGLGCGGSAPPPPPPAPAPSPPPTSPTEAPRPAPTTATATATAPATATVSSEIRKAAPKETACASGDVCGFFLQLVSPGSSPTDLSNKAARMIAGKCGGHVIVYKDARSVLGSGTVLANADDKRACERALGRETADTDFPNAMVWRIAK